MKKISIVVVDDLKEIVEYFSMIFRSESDIDVIGTASSGQEAVRLVNEKKPDIVLMDVQMETKFAGIEAIEKIKAYNKEVKVIVLTIHGEDEILFKAYTAGAMDYIVKTNSIVDILSSVRNVYNNKLPMRPEVAEKILSEFSRLRNEKKSMVYTLNIMSKLTNSEYEILKAKYLGSNYKEIAKQRSVEEVTIRTQVNKILKKFEQDKMKDVINLLSELKIFEFYK